MKLTNEQLKQIIKEELEMVVSESDDWMKGYIDPAYKYLIRKTNIAMNHEDPKIKELANGSPEDLKLALHLMDTIYGELPLEAGEKKWDDDAMGFGPPPEDDEK
tara:strand:- start:1093 stop:1404 length:312 start_codon:yes stop_codon:yes gene_type:complete